MLKWMQDARALGIARERIWYGCASSAVPAQHAVEIARTATVHDDGAWTDNKDRELTEVDECPEAAAAGR